MPRWDIEIAFVRWLASLGGQSWFFDKLAAQMVTNLLFRSIPCVVLLVGYWGATEGSRERLLSIRRRVLGGFGAAGAALLIARVTQNLWENHRPINDPALSGLFQASFQGLLGDDLHAFPSDHAALLVPLVWTLGCLQPWLGAATGAHLACMLCARAYVGLHYPTDILVGAMIGASTVYMERLWPKAADQGLVLIEGARARWPVPTAACLFLIAYCYASMFESIRELANAVLRGLGHP
jgi:undecaprenyl-diphosphatase